MSKRVDSTRSRNFLELLSIGAHDPKIVTRFGTTAARIEYHDANAEGVKSGGDLLARFVFPEHDGGGVTLAQLIKLEIPERGYTA